MVCVSSEVCLCEAALVVFLLTKMRAPPLEEKEEHPFVILRPKKQTNTKICHFLPMPSAEAEWELGKSAVSFLLCLLFSPCGGKNGAAD